MTSKKTRGDAQLLPWRELHLSPGRCSALSWSGFSCSIFSKSPELCTEASAVSRVTPWEATFLKAWVKAVRSHFLSSSTFAERLPFVGGCQKACEKHKDYNYRREPCMQG